MTRVFTAIILLNVVLVGTVAGQEPEPQTQEKRLSGWVEGLRGNDFGVRINALVSLRRNATEAEDALPALIEALQDSDRRIRVGAAIALGAVGPKAEDAVPALIEALKDADRYVLTAAANALVKIDPESKKVISALIKAAHDDDWPSQLAAANALEAIGPKAREAVPALTKVLQGARYTSHFMTSRTAAAMALASMGPEAEEAVTALVNSLQDKHANVRTCSAWALGSMGASVAKQAVPALTKALQDKDKGVRMIAAEALGKMGQEAGEAVPALIEASKDDSRHVRKTAVAALKKIDPEAKAATSGPAGVLHAETGQVSAAKRPWSIASSGDWVQAKASANKITVDKGALVLDGANAAAGEWISSWHDWQGVVDSAEIQISAEMDHIHNKTIETVVKGAEIPHADAEGMPHDWYGRCMIAVVDENRWIMALRSGTDHISWSMGDTIHLLTSNDEGRTWGKLNRWFDETPIEGMPYEDGKCHSEPGLYKMPNGDLILQFWKDSMYAGTKQLRSTDNGKTWATDIERINVAGVTGAPGDMAIGTEDYFIDPENPSDVYMAFEYYEYKSTTGCFLARSRDNGKSYTFLSWMGPLGSTVVDSGSSFEPAIEYVGNRTIVAVLRDGGAGGPVGNRYTWQTKSTDMGASFGPLIDISDQINGGVPKGLWQRTRIYKESNPYFQHNNPLNYARGEGRLWGFGIHSMGGGNTRKPAVYWSDDNGESWCGPELLHGSMYPGTDTGYGDIKRRVDGTFVAATYYCRPRDSTEADVEQYTFNAPRAKVMIEADRDGDGKPDAGSGWHELYNGPNVFTTSVLKAGHWRFKLLLDSPKDAGSPKIQNLKITPR